MQRLRKAFDCEHERVELGEESVVSIDETKMGAGWKYEARGALGPLVEQASLIRRKTDCTEGGKSSGLDEGNKIKCVGIR